MHNHVFRNDKTYFASMSAFSRTAWAICSVSKYFFLPLAKSFTVSCSSAWIFVNWSTHYNTKNSYYDFSFQPYRKLACPQDDAYPQDGNLRAESALLMSFKLQIKIQWTAGACISTTVLNIVSLLNNSAIRKKKSLNAVYG